MSRDRRAIARAEDVVAGRLRIGLLELFDLIHAVNPTGVQGRRASRDYELKGKLQSLLIASHRDELLVEEEADGSIGLRHRYSKRDACHAYIDALDDDARAWIRWHLDTREDPTSSHERPMGDDRRRSGAAVEDVLTRGRRALEEYDFETAIAAFREAMEEERVRLHATRALLEVLVDSLAQDDDALALEDAMGDEAKDDDEVCSLLGLAAARARQPERARRWLADGRGPRVLEAWMVLGRQALADGLIEDAESALDACTRLESAHGDVQELRAQVAVARAEARRPEEEALQKLGLEDEDATEARAREILKRWPESAVAGRTIVAIEARRRERMGEGWRAAASDALDRGELERSRELAHRAAAAGMDVQGLLSRLDVAAREARAVRDAMAVEDVCATLRTDERGGWMRYLELATEMRARVRGRVGDAAVLVWLDELVSVERGKVGAVLDAVLAMREARAAAEASEWSRAVELVDAHGVLGSLRDARVLRTRAHGEVVRLRQREGDAALERAHVAWDAGDVVGATAALEKVELRALREEQRERAERLVARVQERRDVDTRLQRIDAWYAEGAYLPARRELEAMRVIVAAQDREGVETRRALVRAALREQWCVRTTTRAKFGAEELGEMLGPLAREIAPVPWVSSAGEVVIAAAHEQHVFVACIDVEGGGATLHHLQTPEPLGRDADRCVDGDTVWIGGENAVLQFDWRTGDVMRWESLARFQDEDTRREHLFVVPATRTMWLETWSVTSRIWALRVVDLERWTTVRNVAAGRYLIAIPGDEPRFAALDTDTGALLYTGRGNSLGEIAEVRTQRILGVVCHPERDGLVVAASRLDDDAEIMLYDIAPGRPPRSLALPGTNPDLTFWLQSVRGSGRVFAVARMEEGLELFEIEARPDGLVQLDRRALPHNVVLVHDQASRACYIIWDSDRGVYVSTLAARPELVRTPEPTPLPAFSPRFLCKPSDDELFEGLDEAMTAGRWEDVRARLAQTHVDAVSPPLREHYLHLLGLAHARLGDTAKACAVWAEGANYGRGSRILSCHLDSCVKTVEELSVVGPEHAITSLRRAIANAADLRLRGDAPGALACLRIPLVYRMRERQSLARLAETWLALPDEPGDLTVWFDKAQALAQFLAVADDRQRDAPFPDAWNEERVARVASAARAWFARGT